MNTLITCVIAALAFIGFYGATRKFVAIDMRLKAADLPLGSPRRVLASTFMLIFGLATLISLIYFFARLFAQV